jgi:hypothetical protein
VTSLVSSPSGSTPGTDPAGHPGVPPDNRCRHVPAQPPRSGRPRGPAPPTPSAPSSTRARSRSCSAAIAPSCSASPSPSDTGEAASMALDLLTGHDPDLVTDLEGRRPLLSDEDVVVFGFRDADHAAAEGSRPLARPSTPSTCRPSANEALSGQPATPSPTSNGPAAPLGSGSTSTSTSSTTPSRPRSTTTSPRRRRGGLPRPAVADSPLHNAGLTFDEATRCLTVFAGTRAWAASPSPTPIPTTAPRRLDHRHPSPRPGKRSPGDAPKGQPQSRA